MSISLTHPAPTQRLAGESRPDRLRLLRRDLAFVRSGSDRADPLDETVLCLLEAATHAAAAAARLQTFPLDNEETVAELANVLAAARAAVTCATYAMAARNPSDRSQSMTTRTPPATKQEITHVSGADQALRFYEYVDADDVDGLVGLFTEDCEYHRPGYQPWHGRDRLATFYREERVIRSGAHTITALLADGPNVAAHGRFDGELRSGEKVSVGFADFFEMTGAGLFSRRHTYYFAKLV